MAATKYIEDGVLTEAFFTRFKTLTARNLFGVAYQEAAQVFGRQDLHDEFARIERERVRIGHLPPDIYQERYVAYGELMRHAKRSLSDAQFKRFYMCF